MTRSTGNADSGEPSGKSREQLRKDKIVFWGIILGALAVGFLVLGGPAISRAYDESHRVLIECTVTDAEGGVSSASARGAASWSRVLITTSDCGDLIMTAGVTKSNRDDIAAELAQGGKFAFEIGQATQAFRWLSGIVGVAPDVWSFERVD